MISRAVRGAVERQVSRNRMRVQLRVKFATGVVVVDRKHQVAGSSVLIRAALPDPARGIGLGFFQGFRDGGAMCLD